MAENNFDVSVIGYSAKFEMVGHGVSVTDVYEAPVAYEHG